MKEMTVSVLNRASNCPVVQVSGRRYPGMILQGDTLFSFLQLVKGVRSSLVAGKVEEAEDFAVQLEDEISNYLHFYEGVLGEKNIKLPYFRDEEAGQS